MPYILAALRYVLGTAWKIATVVELIGLSSGVGYQLRPPTRFCWKCSPRAA